MKIFLLILITLLSSANALFAQSKIDSSKLDEMFDVLESNNRMMGAVTLRQNGKIIYRRVLGYRSINGGKKIKSDTETLFRIGSITKVFTAVIIFQLIEARKLTLDTKLSKFFPEIPNADKISVEQLLSHRSGLASYPQNVDYLDPKAWIYQPQTRVQMLARFAASKPIFAPGEKRQYCNTNFALLGYIIEVLTNSEYAVQLNKRIIKKLGLKNTRFGGKIEGSKDKAFSYNYRESRWEPVLEQDTSVAAGAGGIISTTDDLTKFLEELFKGKLLKNATLKEMLTPPPDNFSDHTKAFGRANIFDTGKKGYSHDGGIDAFSSLFVYIKEDDLAFAITINGNNYPINRIFWNVLKIYYNQPFTVPSFKAIKLSDETLSKYEGAFNLKQIGMKITIRKDKDGLIGEVSKDDFFHLTPTGSNSFFHEASGIILEFKENPDGSIPSFTMYQGRSISVWEKE